MAHPWVFESNFEAGSNAEWSSETDSTSRLDFPHYSELARHGADAMPYRGAYCMRVNLATSTTDAYVQHDTAFDASASGTVWIKFMLYVSPDLVMANNDESILLALQSTGPVNEAVVVLNYTTANGVRIGIGETSGSQFLPLSLGVWHTVEAKYVVDAGGGNDGTLNLYLDRVAATQVTGLDQAAIIQGRLGVMSQDAGTTMGRILFDRVIVDDAQIYPDNERFPNQVTLTKSAHVFVGPGWIDGVNLLTTNASDNIKLYDTDTANSNDAQSALVELDVANLTGASGPIYFHRGCYALVTGSSCRGTVFLTTSWQKPGVFGPKYYSHAGMKRYGLLRKARAGNV